MDGDPRVVGAGEARRQRTELGGHHFADVAHHRGDARGLCGVRRVVAQQMAVFAHMCAAPRRVDDDGLGAAFDQRPPGVDVSPRVVEGKIEIRDVMYLSISIDHRMNDGATGARFMNHVIGMLQDPQQLMLEM